MLGKIQPITFVLFAGLVKFISARRAPPYVEPLWYSRMETKDDTGLLKRCKRRTRNGTPPKHGNPCARRPKICYFGTQDCDGVGAHPEKMCVCDGRDGTMTWRCEEEVACPPFPDPEKTGCPAPAGEKIDHGNADVCPDDDLGFVNLSSLFTSEYVGGDCGEPGTTCKYGITSCCGTCFATVECSSCNALDGWLCDPTHACYSRGSCAFDASVEKSPFDSVIGGSCIEARTAVFAVYPGMTVTCQAESDPRPTTRDATRYIVLLDDETGTVTGVHFDMPPITSCPPDPIESSLCDFDDECIKPSATVERGTEICTTGPRICLCMRELPDGGLKVLNCRPPLEEESCVTLDPVAPFNPP